MDYFMLIQKEKLNKEKLNKGKLNKEDGKMGVNMTCDIKWDKIF